MRFEYDELIGIGWADGCIEMNSSTVYFATSYITDALNDILKALNTLIPEISLRRLILSGIKNLVEQCGY
jgi:hypothetical protein